MTYNFLMHNISPTHGILKNQYFLDFSHFLTIKKININSLFKKSLITYEEFHMMCGSIGYYRDDYIKEIFILYQNKPTNYMNMRDLELHLTQSITQQKTIKNRFTQNNYNELGSSTTQTSKINRFYHSELSSNVAKRKINRFDDSFSHQSFVKGNTISVYI